MTAFDNNGQLYWTFEELDFDGALQIVLTDVRKLQDWYDQYDGGISFHCEKKIDKYLKVALYLERLKRGQCYA